MSSRSGTAPDNLPWALSSLIGRQRDISAIRSMLDRDGVRLVTITGVGGVGKTRLALETASVVRQDYDAVWLAEFAHLNEPDLVLSTVVAAIGIREEPGRSLYLTVAGTLASHRVLLLLDNCEHLIGSVARVTEQLLSHCAGLTVLATSRQRLGLPGERVWLTQPLRVPPPARDSDTKHLGQFDAVQLFAERARAIQPDFALDAAAASAAASICRQLDGLPLAIELAARWVPFLSLDEIAYRLEDRFRLLVNGSQATARQQTLRGAIEWSYDLLGPREQILFTRLAVFADGCTLEAIEAVCSDEQVAASDIVHLVARLIDASLVSRQDGEGPTRYRVLDTLRLFARERLVLSGHAEATHQRHVEYYLALAERAEPELWGSQLADWLDRLDAEHENVRVALRWTTGRGEAEAALRLCAALGRFWRLRGHGSEGIRWLDAALSWSSGSEPSQRGRALDTAGLLARDRGDHAASKRYFEASLNLRRTVADTPGIARALNNLATVMQVNGDHERALAYLEESLSLFRKVGDGQGEALTLVTLGTIAQLQENIADATSRYLEGLAMFRRLDDRRGIAATLNNLGNLTSQQGDYPSAEAYYRESLQLFQQMNDDHDVAASLGNLARLARDRNDLPQAVNYCQQSLQRFAGLGSLHGIASCMILLADLAVRKGDSVRATKLLATARTMRERTGIMTALDHEQICNSARKLLGDDAFRQAWNSGRALTAEAAIGYALEVWQEPGPAENQLAGNKSGAAKLTPREQEVASLIASGLTNRQIAETLFIAERTADTHVDNIFAKLNVNSRALVAVWAVKHELTGDRRDGSVV